MSEPAITPGMEADVTITVTDEDTAIAMGSGSVPVLATPRVIALVEKAAVAAVADHLPDGMTTVGTHIELEHTAPSPLGSMVTAHARVIGVEDRATVFRVWAVMGDREVAFGEHRRVTVRAEGFGGPAS